MEKTTRDFNIDLSHFFVSPVVDAIKIKLAFTDFDKLVMATHVHFTAETDANNLRKPTEHSKAPESVVTQSKSMIPKSTYRLNDHSQPASTDHMERGRGKKSNASVKWNGF